MVTSIVVTENEYEKGREIFQQLEPGYQIITSDSDEKALAENIFHTNAKAVIIGSDRYQDQLYEALSSDGIIARFGVGIDGINFEQVNIFFVSVNNNYRLVVSGTELSLHQRPSVAPSQRQG